MTWRRSYDTPPPPIEPGSEYAQDTDARYQFLPPEAWYAADAVIEQANVFRLQGGPSDAKRAAAGGLAAGRILVAARPAVPAR